MRPAENYVNKEETYLARINRHDIYIHCLRLAKEILRRGNFEGQQIYVHVGAQIYWETELLRPYIPEREPLGAVANIGLKHDGFVVGEPQELAAYKENIDLWDMDWDWRRFRKSPLGEETFYPLSDLQAQVEYISALAELTLRKTYTNNKTRFSIWGQMFDVAVDLLEANKEQELKFRLIQHSGWGTYYFEFYDNEHELLFALSEAGHIAGVGILVDRTDTAKSITKDYNLRDNILAGTSLKDCKKELRTIFKVLRGSRAKV
jgi:hypothetical protein